MGGFTDTYMYYYELIGRDLEEIQEEE